MSAMPRKRTGVEITIDGRTYWADTFFNLRNLLYDLRNQFEEATKAVEEEMKDRKKAR